MGYEREGWGLKSILIIDNGALNMPHAMLHVLHVPHVPHATQKPAFVFDFDSI